MKSSASPIQPAEVAVDFARVLCAVDGTRAAAEAAAQARALVAPSGSITFLTVTDARGVGASAQGTMSRERAERIADEARRAAVLDGIAAEAEVVGADDRRRAVLDFARHFDLLVLGSYIHSRRAGIMLGSTATFAVHTAELPVLLARATHGHGFPGSVIVATAGEPDLPAVTVGARIAARHGGSLLLAHAGTGDAATRHALAEQAALAQRITGTDPVVLSAPGDPVELIPAYVDSVGAGLLVVGSRSRGGLAALTSVSERLAHRAPCSVLVLRGRTVP